MVEAWTGYARGKRKEHDIAVRKKLLGEVDNARTHIKSILEILYEKKDRKGAEATKKALAELDVYGTEIKMGESGHSYPFFAIQKDADSKMLEKLTGYDRSMLENISTVTETATRLESALIDEEQLDMAREMAKIRQYVTISRDNFKYRLDFIRGLR